DATYKTCAFIRGLKPTATIGNRYAMQNAKRDALQSNWSSLIMILKCIWFSRRHPGNDRCFHGVAMARL
ncbi:MAG: hypothetical protein ABIZ95_15720, partial [Pyrinomonadaceae bacterium]